MPQLGSAICLSDICCCLKPLADRVPVRVEHAADVAVRHVQVHLPGAVCARHLGEEHLRGRSHLRARGEPGRDHGEVHDERRGARGGRHSGDCPMIVRTLFNSRPRQQRQCRCLEELRLVFEHFHCGAEMGLRVRVSKLESMEGGATEVSTDESMRKCEGKSQPGEKPVKDCPAPSARAGPPRSS